MKGTDRLAFAGVLLITLGLYLAWPPLAPLFLGVTCLFIAFVVQRGDDEPKAGS